MSGHRKNKALLFGTVCISLLCLLQAACAPNGEVDDQEGNLIDPDKFALEVKEIYKNQGADNTITVNITPGSPGMCLGEFFVTASLADNMGIVRGSSNRGANGFLCESTLDEQRLENLFLTNQQSYCLGKEDTHFAQGKQVAFRIKAIPGAAIKKGDTYTLNVKVERKGSHPHTETNSTVLTVKRDRKNPKKQTEEASTSDTNASTSDTTPSKASGSTTLPTNHPIPSVDSAIPAEEATTIEARPPILVSDANLLATPNGEIDDLESNLIDPDKFALEVKEIYKNQGADNTITVNITPGSPGMCLGEFFVTASLEDNEGVVSGNKGEKKSSKFVYDVALQDRCLEALFLQSPSNCLGEKDTHFAQGKKVAFRIKAIPGAAIKKGDTYTLTVTVERKGSNAHTETQDVKLTAPRASPVKKKKRTSPRK